MWDVCTNTSTTGQRKNKQRPRVQAESNGIDRMLQNLITFLDLCNNASRGIWTKHSLAETGKHGLAEAGHKHGLAEAKHQATRQGEGWLKTSRNIDSTYQETLEMFPRIRELMESSTREQNVAACVATPRRHAVTTKQPNVHGWAGSPKPHVSRLTITKHEIPRKSSRTRAETNRER